jgi:hypothetical protein
MDGLTQYILNVVLRLDVSAFRYTMLVRPGECPSDYQHQLLGRGIALEEVQISPIGPLRDIQFARYLRSHKHFDAAFIPSNQFPVALRLPAVYVIHDVIYEQFPEQLGRFSRLKRFYLRWVVRMGLRKARQVIAVSNYTKGEVVRCFGQQFETKIQVIYEGWEHLPLASNLSPFANNSLCERPIAYCYTLSYYTACFSSFVGFIPSAKVQKTIKLLYIATIFCLAIQ